LPRILLGTAPIQNLELKQSKFWTDMKILLRYCGLNARAAWRGLVEAQLKRLEHLAAIASAQVTLEWRRECKPAFRVLTWLEIPGPDVHAEAQDHTLPAAVLKVIKDLERQIRSRRNRQAERRKRDLQWRLLPDRGSMRLAG
jgi:ribosomal subunit interface protein